MNSDLHIIDLSTKSVADLDACKKSLSPDELIRMQRFATPALREKFALARGHLRLILAEPLHAKPAELEFTYNEFGKPFLKNHSLQFNMAHSGDYCVIALAPSGLVGIDIECIDRKVATLEIAKRFFTAHEYAALTQSLEAEKLFFHIWTQKEAFLKAIGQGIAFGLDQFEVATTLAESTVTDIKDPDYAALPWQSQSYDHIPGYRLTLTAAP